RRSSDLGDVCWYSHGTYHCPRLQTGLRRQTRFCWQSLPPLSVPTRKVSLLPSGMVVRVAVVDWQLQRLRLLVQRVRFTMGIWHLPVPPLHGLLRLLIRDFGRGSHRCHQRVTCASSGSAAHFELASIGDV